MNKIIWMSDIHLNFLYNPLKFFEEVKKGLTKEHTHIIISGDIAESENVVKIIEEMELHLGIPVLFVLGNHDFYGSTVRKTRNSVSHLNYIPKSEGLPLSDNTIVVGIDGWGDCRNGDFEHSCLVMSDWLYIKDLNKAYLKGRESLKLAIQKFADKEAKQLKTSLLKNIKKYKNIIVVSHAPPFENACLNAGRKSTPDGLPFFSSKILGETVMPFVETHPEINFLWLCGHTHSRITLRIKSNFKVKVAHSEYYLPKIAEEIEYV